MDNRKNFYFSRLSSAEKTACTAIAEALHRLEDELTMSPAGLTDDSWQRMFDTIRIDHPEIFYADLPACRITIGWNSAEVKFAYKYSRQDILMLKKRLSALTSRIMAKISSDSMEVRQRRLHDYLAKTVAYNYEDMSSPESHTIIGPLIHKKAVCDGYAMAYKYLCDKAGITCMTVYGDACDKGVYSSHAWNMVKISKNKCVHVDVTWDSNFCRDTGIVYTFFNKSDDVFSFDHKWDKSMLPPCVPDGNDAIIACVNEKEFRKAVSASLKNGITEIRAFLGWDIGTDSDLSDFLVTKILSLKEAEDLRVTSSYDRLNKKLLLVFVKQ